MLLNNKIINLIRIFYYNILFRKMKNIIFYLEK